jgi:hypothetical protein
VVVAVLVRDRDKNVQVNEMVQFGPSRVKGLDNDGGAASTVTEAVSPLRPSQLKR